MISTTAVRSDAACARHAARVALTAAAGCVPEKLEPSATHIALTHPVSCCVSGPTHRVIMCPHSACPGGRRHQRSRAQALGQRLHQPSHLRAAAGAGHDGHRHRHGRLRGDQLPHPRRDAAVRPSCPASNRLLVQPAFRHSTSLLLCWLRSRSLWVVQPGQGCQRVPGAVLLQAARWLFVLFPGSLRVLCSLECQDLPMLLLLLG